jgi:catechol 2,3-dioxygenase-like lactoylglutathione lyase family enzyme
MQLSYEFTRLLVSRFRECYLFYRDVLGLQPGYGTENDTYADFRLGAVHISLFDKQEMAATLGTLALPARPAGQDHVCLVFAVDDVDAACAHLRAHGVALVTEPADHPDWGIRTAHFRDPDGNVSEINQPLRQ